MKAPAFGSAKLAKPKAPVAPKMAPMAAAPKLAVPKAPAGMSVGAPPPMRTAIPKVAPGMSPLASKLKGVPM